MYLTTKQFQTEVNRPSRRFSWSGQVILKDGEIFKFTDRDILKGSGYIHRACSGPTELEIGSVYAAEFGLSLFANIDRYRLEGAQLSLRYHLHYGAGKEESIPMGLFEVTEAFRSKKRLELKGYDFMLRFDRSFAVKETFGTAYELLEMICKKCRVILGMKEDQVKALPNGEELLSIYSDHDIETYRDFLHYIASTLACVALINRQGQLVLQPYGSQPVAIVEAKHRFESSVSDFRTYYTAINSTNAKTKMAEYYAFEEDTGLTLNLGINPLMQLGLRKKREVMCQRLLEAISQISYTPFEATTIGNPSLDPGDAIEYIVDGEGLKGIITSIEYKINGKHRIQSVGKNPYYAQTKSKHDKNIVGLLNQLESEHVAVHAYTNAQAFEIDQEPIPVIQFEFASNKETQALFNATLLMQVETVKETVPRSVQIRMIDSGEETLAEAKTYELVTEQETPIQVKATYVLNDVQIEDHIPIQSCSQGQHILTLFYPLMGLQENTINRFTVLLEADQGKVHIENGQIIAAISGQSLGSQDVWDGKIKISEMLHRFLLQGALSPHVKIRDRMEVQNLQRHDQVHFESVRPCSLTGLSLRGMEEYITTEVDYVSRNNQN